MFAFFVSGKAATASFRVPETHTFHQTLPLPPRTTLIGMMGAALGLSLADAHRFASENRIRVGVYGSHKGLMKDLWNYRRVTNKDLSEEKIKNREHYGVLIREYLTDCDFSFFFGSESHESLEPIRDAFAHPVYALTVGNSDDLLKITSISPIEEVQEKPETRFEHTILPGDLSSHCIPAIDYRSLPVTARVDVPQVYLLPTRFTFDGNRRIVTDRQLFTFVGSPVTLSIPIPACHLGGKNIVLV